MSGVLEDKALCTAVPQGLYSLKYWNKKRKMIRKMRKEREDIT
jgi:hypothetical protein